MRTKKKSSNERLLQFFMDTNPGDLRLVGSYIDILDFVLPYTCIEFVGNRVINPSVQVSISIFFSP